jgi:hypothetical protein
MKIFTTANKIFALSPKIPVGVMVYNNAQFIGVYRQRQEQQEQ